MFAHRGKDREAAFNEAAKPMPEGAPYRAVSVAWMPDAETGQELGELETLETLHIARRTFARANEAARDSERLLKDATQALDEAKARVRRMAERAV
jgi:hypothetical protein